MMLFIYELQFFKVIFHRIIESQNGLGWKGYYRSSSSKPVPWAGTRSPGPGCSELHPTWP